MDSVDENVYVSTTSSGGTTSTPSVSTSKKTTSAPSYSVSATPDSSLPQMNAAVHEAGRNVQQSGNELQQGIRGGVESGIQKLESGLHSAQTSIQQGLQQMQESLKSHLFSSSSSSPSTSATTTTTTTTTAATSPPSDSETDIPVGPYPPSATSTRSEYSLPKGTTTTTTTSTDKDGGLLHSLKDKVLDTEERIFHHSDWEKQKQEEQNRGMEAFPTKADTAGDLESFKKAVHSGYERGLGLDQVRDERHYKKAGDE